MAPCGSGRKLTFACAFVSDRRACGPNNHYIFSANRSDQLYFCPFDVPPFFIGLDPPQKELMDRIKRQHKWNRGWLRRFEQFAPAKSRYTTPVGSQSPAQEQQCGDRRDLTILFAPQNRTPASRSPMHRAARPVEPLIFLSRQVAATHRTPRADVRLRNLGACPAKVLRYPQVWMSDRFRSLQN